MKTKRLYNKPEIVFEDFSLSTNIATCETKTNVPNNTECGYVPEGTTIPIFVNGITGCTKKVDDDGYNGFCYHAPTEANNLFNS